MSGIQTLATLVLGGAFDATELGENDIQPNMKLIEELQQRLVTGTDDVYVELIDRAALDRVTAERDGLQLLLNSVDQRRDELESLLEQVLENINRALPSALLHSIRGKLPARAPCPVADESEREPFEVWHRGRFATRHSTGQPTRDMHNGILDPEYGPPAQQQMWEAWQARAALSLNAADQRIDELTALKVDETVCRGSAAMGTACGTCARCAALKLAASVTAGRDETKLKGMIEARGGEFAIMIDEANAHYGWTFKRHPGGMWVSGRKATEVEMHAARAYAKHTNQQ